MGEIGQQFEQRFEKWAKEHEREMEHWAEKFAKEWENFGDRIGEGNLSSDANPKTCQ